jgi:transcriptional regulator with XRE-family HTH domain
MSSQTRVRMALQWKGKTQKWLAEETGIHHVTLSEILNGRTPPSERQKELIAAALRMPKQRLFMELSLAESAGLFFGNEVAEQLYAQRLARRSQREEEEEEL